MRRSSKNKALLYTSVSNEMKKMIYSPFTWRFVGKKQRILRQNRERDIFFVAFFIVDNQLCWLGGRCRWKALIPKNSNLCSKLNTIENWRRKDNLLWTDSVNFSVTDASSIYGSGSSESSPLGFWTKWWKHVSIGQQT